MARGGMGHAKWAKDKPCTDITMGEIITEASCGPDICKHHTQLFLSSSHNSSTRGFSHFTDKEGKGQG